MTCHRQKLTVWPVKLLSKKYPGKHRKSWTTFQIGWLWRALEAKLMTPGQLLGYPWKLWGKTVQTSYVDFSGIKIEPDIFFAHEQGNQWKRIFFTLKRREILGWVIKGQMMAIHRRPNAFLTKIGYGSVLTRSGLRATKYDPFAKIWGVRKKTRYGGFPSVWGWGVGTVKKFLAEYLLCGACIQLKKQLKPKLLAFWSI